MSTRAVYTFKDDYNTFSIYKHHDGYPSGAVDFIKRAFKFSWFGNQQSYEGRFDAGDMSAAFVAANKSGGGGVYLTTKASAHGDLSYDYVIYYKNGYGVCIDAYEDIWTPSDDGETKKSRKKIYCGDFATYLEQNDFEVAL